MRAARQASSTSKGLTLTIRAVAVDGPGRLRIDLLARNRSDLGERISAVAIKTRRPGRPWRWVAATASTPDIAASGETELSATALVADHRPADLVALQLVTTSGIVVTPSQRSIEPFVLLSAVAGSCLLFWAVAGAMAATAVLLVGSCTAALDRRRRATPGDSWLDPHRLVVLWPIAGLAAAALVYTVGGGRADLHRPCDRLSFAPRVRRRPRPLPRRAGARTNTVRARASRPRLPGPLHGDRGRTRPVDIARGLDEGGEAGQRSALPPRLTRRPEPGGSDLVVYQDVSATQVALELSGVAAHIAGVPAGAVHERRVLNVVLDYADGASTTELCTLLARLGRLG